jgi:ubiquitin-protein ligase
MLLRSNQVELSTRLTSNTEKLTNEFSPLDIVPSFKKSYLTKITFMITGTPNTKYIGGKKTIKITGFSNVIYCIIMRS